MARKPIILKAQLQSNYTVTGTDWGTGVTDMNFDIPEDGLYMFINHPLMYLLNSAGTQAYMLCRLAVDGKGLVGTTIKYDMRDGANNIPNSLQGNGIDFMYCKKGQNIEMEAYEDAGYGGLLQAATDVNVTMMMAVKIA